MSDPWKKPPTIPAAPTSPQATAEPGPEWRRVLVVFSGNTDLPWLRLLKPGYRHCFVALWDGCRWVTVEPLFHFTDVAIHPVDASFDIKAFYRSQGFDVVETRLRKAPKRCAPWRLYTCVEGVKRILGIHDRGVFTPWQLKQFLEKEQKPEKVKKTLDFGEQIAYT